MPAPRSHTVNTIHVPPARVSAARRSVTGANANGQTVITKVLAPAGLTLNPGDQVVVPSATRTSTTTTGGGFGGGRGGAGSGIPLLGGGRGN